MHRQRLSRDVRAFYLKGMNMTTLDSLMHKSTTNAPNTAIAWILIASYCYYQRDTSILSDEAFDKLCKKTLDNYSGLVHNHKHLVTEDSLRAGTLFNLKHNDYPLIVQCVAGQMMEKVCGDWRGEAMYA